VRDRQGFTLVELAVVLVIIGLLAGIAIPNFENMRIQAREASVVCTAHVVQLAAEDFAVQSGGLYSDQGADLLPLLPGAALQENPFTHQLTEPQFGLPATTRGQVGVVVLLQGGVPVGTNVTAYGQDGLVAAFATGH